MKIEIHNEKTILFLNKYILGEICLEDPKSIQEYFKKIIMILMKYHNIYLIGEHLVKVYIDNIYGVIMEIEPLIEDDQLGIDFIDMKIIFELNNTFIYEIDDYDYFNILGNYIDKYYYNQKYYAIIHNIDEISYLKFLEYSKIIYGNKAKEILKEAIKIT